MSLASTSPSTLARSPSERARPACLAALARLAFGAALVLEVGGCEPPPEPDPVEGPDVDAAARKLAMRAEAHREALQRVVKDSRAVLIAADPVGAWRAGHAPAALPPLTLPARNSLSRELQPLLREATDIDEQHLQPPEVVILRVLRFGLQRLSDDLDRHPWVRVDPGQPLVEVAEILAELRYRLITDDCDGACEVLPRDLARALPNVREQLEAASIPMTLGAQRRAAALALAARALASQPSQSSQSSQPSQPQGEEDGEAKPDPKETLSAGLGELADALDAHATWLGEVGAALPTAESHHTWTAKPPPLRPGGVASIERLPPHLGPRALVRLMSVRERLDLEPGPAGAQLTTHIKRWQGIGAELLAGEDAVEIARADLPTPLTLERCTAGLETLRAGLETFPDLDPPKLDCAAYLRFSPPVMSEGELLVELLDLGVIEPQRRLLRHGELPELGLIRGRWSEAVHLHLRRIMLLARVEVPQARALALIAGRRALCRAKAVMWVHGELGPDSEVALALGSACADVVLPPGDADAGPSERITARVLADPMDALTGYGLSLIGDEPAQMVGFDRFFWAPLGQMRTLATPPGMHPDGFILPSEGQPQPSPREAGGQPGVQVQIEELGRGTPDADARTP